MKVLVTGDRNWCNATQVAAAIACFPAGTVVVHGGCRGADLMCARAAVALGHTVREYAADWASYGRGAGPLRNQRMLDEEHVPAEPIDACVAFHDDITNSRGTRDMLARATRTGITTYIITSKTDVKRSLGAPLTHPG